MRFGQILKAGLIAGMFTAAVSLASVPAQSQYQQVFINGQPMHPAVVAQIQQAIGIILPSGEYFWDGQYLYDGYGNAVPLSLGGTGPTQYPGGTSGEVYPDGSGSWANQNTGIGGVYDPSGGCEAGSCVNILD
jgi:hypothetical protein